MVFDGVNLVVVSSAITDVPEVLLLEAGELDVEPLRTSDTLKMREYNSFAGCVCILAGDGLVPSNVIPSLRNLNRKVAWNSWKSNFASFLPSQYSCILCRINASKY